jgi:hypothetical protein
MALVYMPDRQQAVLFGGRDGTGQVLGDTWIWQSGTGCWSELISPGKPPARESMAAAYDPIHHLVLLYGGDSAGQFDTDTWTWNGQIWTQVATGQPITPTTTSVMPPALVGGPVAGFDPVSQTVLIFGEYAGVPQTWSWDGSSWRQLSPSRSPDARASTSLALDPTNGRLLLFGGYSLTQGAIGDTWTWDGTNWNKLAPVTSPSKRFRATMASWAAGGKVILRGGVAGPDVGDAWTWDGSNWTLIASPGVRADEGAIDIGPRVLFFGGDGPAGAYDNFESWDGAVWSASQA